MTDANGDGKVSLAEFYEVRATAWLNVGTARDIAASRAYICYDVE